MPVHRSAGAIIFRETKKGKSLRQAQGKEFLLLHYPSITARGTQGGHWDFSKGHIEKREKTEDAVKREVKEETGISDLEIIPGFKETIRYFVNYGGKKSLKFVAFFLAQTNQEKVILSWEHQGYVWLPYEEAYKKITYTNAKQMLNRAHDFLLEKDV